MTVVLEPIIPIRPAHAIEEDVAGQVLGAFDVAVPIEEDWEALRRGTFRRRTSFRAPDTMLSIWRDVWRRQ